MSPGLMAWNTRQLTATFNGKDLIGILFAPSFLSFSSIVFFIFCSAFNAFLFPTIVVQSCVRSFTILIPSGFHDHGFHFPHSRHMNFFMTVPRSFTSGLSIPTLRTHWCEIHLAFWHSLLQYATFLQPVQKRTFWRRLSRPQLPQRIKWCKCGSSIKFAYPHCRNNSLSSIRSRRSLKHEAQ